MACNLLIKVATAFGIIYSLPEKNQIVAVTHFYENKNHTLLNNRNYLHCFINFIKENNLENKDLYKYNGHIITIDESVHFEETSKTSTKAVRQLKNETVIREVEKEVKRELEKEVKEEEDDEEDVEEDVEEKVSKDRRNIKRHFHLLRSKIKKWWNDPEPDDENDKKRINHLFQKLRAINKIDKM